MSNANKYLRFLTRLEQKSKSLASPERITNGSDVLYQQGYRISFTRLGVNAAAGTSVFKAFVTAFNETWNSNWNSETVYGRVDPIVMFKNTERNVSLGFKVPAADSFEALQNMAELQTLIQSLYPSYKSFTPEEWADFDGTLSQSPLIRVQLADLFGKAHDLAEGRSHVPVPGDDMRTALDELRTDPTANTSFPGSNFGMLCYVRNLTINYNLEGEDGIFEGQWGRDGYIMLPKMIEVNMDLGVLHERRMGWWLNRQSGELAWSDHAPGYPYGYPEQLKRGSPSAQNTTPTPISQTTIPDTSSPPPGELSEAGDGDIDADAAGDDSVTLNEEGPPDGLHYDSPGLRMRPNWSEWIKPDGYPYTLG